MSTAAESFAAPRNAKRRIDVLFDELSELTGQRNAIDGRIVDIVAEIHGGGDGMHGLWGSTGCRSLSALVAWKTGCSSRNAETVVAVAERIPVFPRLTEGLREGRYSLDQVGAVAENAADGSDDHYAELVDNATVAQLRKAVNLEPKPEKRRPEPERSFRKSPTGPGGEYTKYTITLSKLEAARFDAAVDSHADKVMADWRRDGHPEPDPDARAPIDPAVPPRPTKVDGFMSLVDAGWDADAAARPHGQRSTVVVHVDVEQKVANVHLGPLLTDAERRLMLCDATCEVWFEQHGRPIGVGRTTRTVNRRMRRALEHRDHGTCVVPGCGATRGLHAHHLRHWEDGGPIELWNMVLVCPYHHRMHHRGELTLTGPAEDLVVTDRLGTRLTNQSLARPPTKPPPDVPPYKGPSGERLGWWWYDPYEPKPPPTDN